MARSRPSSATGCAFFTDRRMRDAFSDWEADARFVVAVFSRSFSKLKASPRKTLRMLDQGGLWNAVGHISPSFTAIECANYCIAAGYEPK